MDEIHFDSTQQFNDYYGFETLHPLVSVVRYDKQLPIEECVVHYGVYALFLMHIIFICPAILRVFLLVCIYSILRCFFFFKGPTETYILLVIARTLCYIFQYGISFVDVLHDCSYINVRIFIGMPSH